MNPAVAKTAPRVTIVLDKERHLLYDLNSIAALEDVTGVNMLEQLDKGVFNARFLRAMVWAGLLHEDAQVKFNELGKIATPPELSLSAIGKLVDIANAAEVMAKAIEAWRLARPESAAADDAERPTEPSPVVN